MRIKVLIMETGEERSSLLGNKDYHLLLKWEGCERGGASCVCPRWMISDVISEMQA